VSDFVQLIDRVDKGSLQTSFVTICFEISNRCLAASYDFFMTL
jgi:hypothetical protein